MPDLQPTIRAGFHLLGVRSGQFRRARAGEPTGRRIAVVADWTPEPHHQAFPGVLNGGIIGTPPRLPQQTGRLLTI